MFISFRSACLVKVRFIDLSLLFFTFSIVCFRNPTWQRSPQLDSFSCPACAEAPAACTQDPMCEGQVHTLTGEQKLIKKQSFTTGGN